MPDQHLLSQIKALIAIQSTAGRPQDLHVALGLITAQLSAVPGITIERFERNGKPSILAYYGAQRPERFRVLLNGHVDVVAGRPDQFKPLVKNDRLYGRGALDMKATAVVLADVFCRMAGNVDYPLGLQIVTDEEIGGSDGTKYQIEQGVMADFVIVGEFTPLATVCNESRGICWAEVTFAGKAAHSAYPWDGSNAILKACTFIDRLTHLYPTPMQKEWVTTANIASVNTANATFNRVPDEALVKLDMRYIPGDSNFTDTATTMRFLQTIDPTADITIVSHEPCHYAGPDGADLQLLAKAISTATSQPTTFIQKPGAADVRYYSAQEGTEAVVFGLQGAGLHGDEEYIKIGSIATYQQILSDFLGHLR